MGHIEALPVHFLALISRERSFSAQLQILARQIGGALPQTAIGTLVDVDLAAEVGAVPASASSIYA